jgi:hypothetical protein
VHCVESPAPLDVCGKSLSSWVLPRLAHALVTALWRWVSVVFQASPFSGIKSWMETELRGLRAVQTDRNEVSVAPTISRSYDGLLDFRSHRTWLWRARPLFSSTDV